MMKSILLILKLNQVNSLNSPSRHAQLSFISIIMYLTVASHKFFICATHFVYRAARKAIYSSKLEGSICTSLEDVYQCILRQRASSTKSHGGRGRSASRGRSTSRSRSRGALSSTSRSRGRRADAKVMQASPKGKLTSPRQRKTKSVAASDTSHKVVAPNDAPGSKGGNWFQRNATKAGAESAVAAVQSWLGLRADGSSSIPLVHYLMVYSSFLAIEKLSLTSVMFWLALPLASTFVTSFMVGMTGGTLLKGSSTKKKTHSY